MQARHRVSRSAGAILAMVAVCGVAVLLGYAMGNYAITAVTTARRKPVAASAPSQAPAPPLQEGGQVPHTSAPPAAAPAPTEEKLLTELEDPPAAPAKTGATTPVATPASGKAPDKSPARTTADLFRVQVGPYGTRQEAVAVAGRLLSDGYQTYVTPSRPFRVQVGAFSSRDAAERLAAELVAKKYSVRVSP